jgi:hypothetical protein
VHVAMLLLSGLASDFLLEPLSSMDESHRGSLAGDDSVESIGKWRGSYFPRHREASTTHLLISRLGESMMESLRNCTWMRWMEP